ncbi:MAG: SLBB domain-containing protein [Terracidiphilus sp.]
MKSCIRFKFFYLPLTAALCLGCSAARGQAGETQPEFAGTQDEADNTSCANSLLPGSDGCVQAGAAEKMAQDAVGQSDARATVRRNPPEPRRSPVVPPAQPSEFQRFVADSTGQLLSIYGADLFRNVPSTFSPDDLAPVSAGYIVGPNDEIRVRIWGQINFNGNLAVDRSGDIFLPQAGAIHVAGLPASALDQQVRSAVARVFRNFDLTAGIGRIRSVQVYVTGWARRPGAYHVSSLSSLIDALFASGGPSPQGSLRHIQLNRDGRTVADLDLYALLLGGDKSGDARLEPEDVLFIPPVGPQVAIFGSVETPGIYELRGTETIGDLVADAGQRTAVSSSGRISLDRVEQGKILGAIQFPLDSAGLAVRLAGGDILRLDSVLPAFGKTVTLRGNVANPGRYEMRPGMRLSDLLPDRDSLVSRDYWWKRSHLGLPGPEFEAAISTLGSNNQELDSAANKTILAAALTPDWQDKDSGKDQPTGQAAGETQRSSGTHSIASELGQTRNRVQVTGAGINWEYAVIERQDPESLKTSLIPFDLGKLVLAHDPSQDLPLEAGDTVTVFSQSDIRVPLDQQTKYVNLEGEIAHAGIYSVEPGETLRDLVLKAGGLTGRAYLFGSEFIRESTRILQQQRLDEYIETVSMEADRGSQKLAISGASTASASSEAAASGAAAQDLIARLRQIKATGRVVLDTSAASSSINDIPAMDLENGDRFIVPFRPSTVNVVGAVYDQNTFLFKSGLPVGRYLRMAGGPNRNADARNAFLIRADGSVISSRSANSAWNSGFSKVLLNPGDTIVVPEKMLRPSGLRQILDWSQMFSQLAVGAAAVALL